MNNKIEPGKIKEEYKNIPDDEFVPLNGNFIKEYDSCREAYIDLGVNPKSSSHISDCCKGKMKTYKGFIWKYKK